MATIVDLEGIKVTYNPRKDAWSCKQDKGTEILLNTYYEMYKDKKPLYDPFPAGTALSVLKKQTKAMGIDVKVLKQDKQPKYDPKAIY